MSKRTNGEGSVYQVGTKWRGSLQFEGIGKDRKRKYFTGKTKREVLGKIDAARRALERGATLTDASKTVGEYLRSWLDDHQAQRIRHRTYASYLLQIQRADPHIGSIRLDALKPGHIQHCYAELLKQGLSPRSVEMVHAVLRMAFRQAAKWRILDRPPTELVSPPRPAHREMQTLTPEQVQTLFETTENDRLHALWVLLATSGMRIGEALGLTWSDVDTKAGTVAIRRSLQRQKGVGLVYDETKTARSRRTIDLPSETLDALEHHRERQEWERRKAKDLWEGKGGVFYTEIGRPIEASSVNSALKVRLQHAGLPSVRVHDLRHTAATFLLGQEVPVHVVSEILGHSTAMQTLNTYAHVQASHRKDAASKMGGLFKAREITV